MPPKTMVAVFASISAVYHVFPHTSEIYDLTYEKNWWKAASMTIYISY